MTTIPTSGFPFVLIGGMIRAMPDRPQKITFGEMRDLGVRGVLIYCADYRCGRSRAISGDHWPDLRLSDIEPGCHDGGGGNDAAGIHLCRANASVALLRADPMASNATFCSSVSEL
jgi:hypothetical protein